MSDEKKEIVSLNKGLMSMDFDDISVEELEHRLELAVALFFDVEAVAGNCGTNTCGTYTSDGNCGTNGCGTY